MLTKNEAKEKLKALIEFYSKNKESFSKTSEQDIRLKLIDKAFKFLGWDLDGDETPGEVQREESISNRESKKKKADYVFRLNGVPKFIVEAKAIKNVDMSSDEFREQAVGYAYNLACSWAVLTNFVRITIYYVDKDDNTYLRNINDISDLNNFERNFESLWLLSKESVKEQLLEKEAEKIGIKPQKEKVGKQLFEDLKDWRKKLSDNIKKKYDGKYKDYEIEEIVQKVIDRLIFIRKLEDLELEERKLDQLVRKFSSETNYYRDLKLIFKYYRDKYNSGLFGVNGEEQECDIVDIENSIIEQVIKGMYKPKGRKIEYNFAAIDADVLGSIYEQYLSFILRDTPKKAKLEGGRTHRKEQGIYYTPTYIVDYIVKNSVSDYLKNKDIDEILEVRILDPACGSGSFLIRAFSEVCRIIESKLKKGEKAKEWTSFNSYSGRLTLNQKIAILIRCIYGVDLDKKAVEIAQLNLLLKLLEGETSETLAKIEHAKKLLPMLNTNIKNGNSLIDDENIDPKHFFKWEEQFKEIMNSGGFDIVIGNPPYVNIFNIKDPARSFFQKNYETATNKSDLYAFFIEKGIKDLVKERGMLGFITSNTWASIQSFENLRKVILENTLVKDIVPLNLGIFADAMVVPIIIVIKKIKNKEMIKSNKIRFFSLNEKDNSYTLTTEVSQEYFLNSAGHVISFSTNNESRSVFDKLSTSAIPLGDIAKFSLGIKSADNEKFVSKTKKDASSRKVLKGKDIKRYTFVYTGDWIWYKPEEMMKRKGAGPRKPECFEVPKKIILQEISGDKIIATLDTEGYYALDTVNLLYELDKKFSMEFILGLLNSKLINFWYGSQFKGIHVKLNELRIIPIRTSTSEQQKTITQFVDKVLLLNKKLVDFGDKKTDEKKRIEEDIKKTDNEIDEEVYKLYGITAEEKKVIEESLK